MDVGAFDFALPEERIALRPAEPRDAARLLRVDARDGLSDHIVRDLPGLLRPGDLLVFNDTRVIPAQLQGIRERNGASVAVSATLVERLDEATWWVLARPGRRLKLGDRIRFGFDGNACLAGRLDATVRTKHMDGRVQLAFDLAGPALDEAIRQAGRPPLPPYIAARRAADARDADDYQTVYAREDGAVAAPTAGLHFTPELLAMLELAGVESAFLTLHVGAGTFAPMKAERTEDHVMHAEHGEVTPAAAERIDAARARGGRVVAVGTTSLRLLETATAPDGVTHPFAGRTDIFITPGYRFRGADALMTNFHLPRSTLFMLVAAFCGLETMRRAYAHAIEAGYRFYSYGDASLLFPASLE